MPDDYFDDEPGGQVGPPRDEAAEQALLGGMMLDSNVIPDVTELIDSTDFYKPAHETVFRAICTLFHDNGPVDPIAVGAELVKRGNIRQIGGHTYLHTLVDSTPTAANATYYADIVRSRARLRRLVEAGMWIGQTAQAAEGEVDDIVDACGARFNQAVQGHDPSQALLVGEDFAEFCDHIESLQRDGRALGVMTGYQDLDTLTLGLHPGQMIVIAARPGVGKSTAALDIARRAALRDGHGVAFFTLEMSRTEVQMRLVSAEGNIPLQHIRNGQMDEADWMRFGNVRERVMSAPLVIDDSHHQTLLRIKSTCRRLAQRRGFGLGLVVVDHLGLLQPAQTGGRRTENRQTEVAELSRGLKLMAKELQVPVLALSQLNRMVEARTEKKPQLSDLRDSGSIEQDADVVILLHREDAYEKESPRAGEADFIVAKHRNGPTATITVAAQMYRSRFADMART
ncbi:replicative DNA helicase [Streptomyces sp. cg36]|uniref:replicative DNA helicase n=1 Tax=Streptomyces sp. cg36 TaxID=3238798 RepID=UPI0034E27D8C